MKTATFTITIEIEDHVNPLFIEDAIHQTLELCDAEVIESVASNVTKEDNLNWEAAHFSHV
jgi:hypothetical protein